MDNPTDLISLKEATTLLKSVRPGKRLHIGTLRRWIESGRLPGYRKPGSPWLWVSRADVLAQETPERVAPKTKGKLLVRSPRTFRADQRAAQARLVKAGIFKGQGTT
jgi:hypothetical protein